MDDSKLHTIVEQRGFGDLVTVAVLPPSAFGAVVVASLVVPIGVAVAGFVQGSVAVGIIGIVAIPVVYFGVARLVARVLARSSSQFSGVYFFQHGLIRVKPNAEPAPYTYADVRLTKRVGSDGRTEIDVDTFGGERLITLDPSVDTKLNVVEALVQAAAGGPGAGTDVVSGT